jgi:hypothetical protein
VRLAWPQRQRFRFRFRFPPQKEGANHIALGFENNDLDK